MIILQYSSIYVKIIIINPQKTNVMKKFWKFIIATLLLMIPVAIFAQDVPTEPGTSFDIMSLFTSFAGYAAGVLVVTGVITRYILKNLSTLGRSITSWVVAAIVAVIGYFMQLGIFAGVDWLNLIIIVLSFAAGSNVIYNVEWIRQLLALLKILPDKATVTKTVA
ncbi:MAG: hypothetical protein WC333_01870 [Dehalococcoidia bacterium]|jgi:uncharacterized membrane protein YqaE (UPF0057 family)